MATFIGLIMNSKCQQTLIVLNIFAKDFANPSKPVCFDSRLNAFNIFTVKIIHCLN